MEWIPMDCQIVWVEKSNIHGYLPSFGLSKSKLLFTHDFWKRFKSSNLELNHRTCCVNYFPKEFHSNTLKIGLWLLKFNISGKLVQFYAKKVTGFLILNPFTTNWPNQIRRCQCPSFLALLSCIILECQNSNWLSGTNSPWNVSDLQNQNCSLLGEPIKWTGPDIRIYSSQFGIDKSRYDSVCY